MYVYAYMYVPIINEKWFHKFEESKEGIWEILKKQKGREEWYSIIWKIK